MSLLLSIALLVLSQLLRVYYTGVMNELVVANIVGRSQRTLFLKAICLNPPGAPSFVLLQTVGFGDKLFFRKLPESAVADGFECNMEGVPTDASNLVLRALDLFRERTSSNCFYEVRNGGQAFDPLK